MPKKKKFSKSLYLPLAISFGLLTLLSLLAFVLPYYGNQNLFKDLEQVTQYASSHDEYPKRDNKNIIKPDYRSFYRSNLPGFFSRNYANLLRYTGLISPSDWSSDDFKKLMQRLTKYREEQTYKNLFIHKLTPGSGAQVVVWGDVQGAFHSLVRSLNHLEEEGLISKNLELAEDVYFVFLGDVVSRSPYIMETLMLVMRLMEKNPRNVFYMRGNHEANNYWQGYGLKKELKIRAAHLKAGEKFPLSSLVQRFFNTLPVALYVAVDSAPDSRFVRFSHEGGNEFTIERLNLHCYTDFLHVLDQDPLRTYQIEENKGFCKDDKKISLRAIVRAEIKRKSYQKMDGMRLLPPEKGVPTWTLLSCPTTTYQEGVEFFYDAFGLIKTASKVDDWTITLHNQDVRELSGFSKRTYEFLSGQAKE